MEACQSGRDLMVIQDIGKKNQKINKIITTCKKQFIQLGNLVTINPGANMAYKVHLRSVLLPEYGPVIFCRHCSHSADFCGKLRDLAINKIKTEYLKVENLLNMYICSACGKRDFWFKFKNEKLALEPREYSYEDINWNENASIDDRWFIQRGNTHNDYYFDPECDDYVFLNKIGDCDE